MTACKMDFSIITTKICTDDCNNVTAYGFKVTTAKNETLSIENISTNLNEVEQFISICKKNDVSMISIHDILEDFLP